LLFGAVVGRVTAGHAGAVVMLEPLDTASARVPFALRRATVAADGSFAIEPVLPGTWRVAGPGGAAEIVVSAGSAAACELR
ncbi:MAG: hypothetical protein KDE27_09710, partial [Planctomycetes bacterium]|nr:hypothetical protein [Planctomycetota bacterium]